MDHKARFQPVITELITMFVLSFHDTSEHIKSQSPGSRLSSNALCSMSGNMPI